MSVQVFEIGRRRTRSSFTAAEFADRRQVSLHDALIELHMLASLDFVVPLADGYYRYGPALYRAKWRSN